MLLFLFSPLFGRALIYFSLAVMFELWATREERNPFPHAGPPGMSSPNEYACLQSSAGIFTAVLAAPSFTLFAPAIFKWRDVPLLFCVQCGSLTRLTLRPPIPMSPISCGGVGEAPVVCG